MTLNCDFCNKSLELNQAYTIIGKAVDLEFRDPATSDLILGIEHDPLWAACERCNWMINSGMWDALVLFVLVSEGLVNDPIYDFLLRITYEKAFGVPGLVCRSALIPAQIASLYRVT